MPSRSYKHDKRDKEFQMLKKALATAVLAACVMGAMASPAQASSDVLQSALTTNILGLPTIPTTDNGPPGPKPPPKPEDDTLGQKPSPKLNVGPPGPRPPPKF